MTDENKQVETGEAVDMTQDYLATINELKKTTVSRQKYDEVMAENRKLLNSIVNGQEKQQEVVEEPVDTNSLKKELYGGDCQLNNLEYWKKTLELREATIKEGKPDPFLPIGQQIMPTNEDIECANRVAEVVKDCIEYADGDSAVFTNELQRRTVEAKIR